MIWTIVLVFFGITSMWLSAKHWYGWALNVFAEVLWFAYALTIGSQALAVMACIWGALALRNTIVTRKAQA